MRFTGGFEVRLCGGFAMRTSGEFAANTQLAKSRSWALGALLLGAGGRMLSSVLEKIYVISLVSRHKKTGLWACS